MKNRFSPLSLMVVLTAGLTLAALLVRDRSISGSAAPQSEPAPSLQVETDLSATPTAALLPCSLGSLPANREFPLALNDALGWTTNQVEGGSEAVPRQALAARWASVPFEQMLGHLQSVTEGPLWAAHDLEHWLLAHPEDGAEMVLQSLQGVTTNDWTLSGLLIQGLAQVDIDPAHQAFLSVLSDPNSFTPTVVIQAAMAAGSLGANADSDLKETLRHLIDSPLADEEFQLSEAALLSLARLAKDDSVSQQSMIQRLTPWLEASAAPEETIKAFNALATAAVDQPDLVARAMQLTQSADHRIRAAAVDYLNSISQSSNAALDQPHSGS